MQLLRALVLLGFASLTTARDARHLGKREHQYESRAASVRRPQTGNVFEERDRPKSTYPELKYHKRAGATIVPQNRNTTSITTSN